MERFLKAFLFAASLSGCASYQKLPLATQPDFPQRLEVDASSLHFPGLSSHRFDPSNGLDMTEVAMLAVSNNPALKLARDDAGIAGAQAFSAGLLPDPGFGFSPQYPRNGLPGENFTAFDLGLNYDFGALMTRSLRVAAAKADHRKADLSLLWQEWQVVGQSRLLFARIQSREKEIGILKMRRDLLALRQRREESVPGELTSGVVTMDANALQGINRQIEESGRLALKDRASLDALLGLSPEVRLDLVGEPEMPDPDRDEIAHRLSGLSRFRPDLRALKAGYEAQDLRLRKAILAQFPAIGVGLIRSGDNTGIHYNGFSLNLSLPIFSGNRGNVAIEQATRKRLHDEYRQRLNAAFAEISQLLADRKLLDAELSGLNGNLAKLSRLASGAKEAYREGNLDLAAYSSIRDVELSAKSERNAVRESIIEERIALLTLVGGQERESK